MKTRDNEGVKAVNAQKTAFANRRFEKSGDLQVVKGGTLSNDNDKDLNKSAPVHVDENAMIGNNADT